MDSFQGMEANIVLLSLVRSNKKRQIGFLSQQNRICVCLSRAKLGLYITGNISILSECSTVWEYVKKCLVSQNRLGTTFPISL